MIAGRTGKLPVRPRVSVLEVETQFRRLRARRDVVGSAEGGKEIIESHCVRQIDDRKTEAPLVAVSVEEVVLAYGEIKEAAWLDPLWIVVVILGSWRTVSLPDWTRTGMRGRKWARVLSE